MIRSTKQDNQTWESYLNKIKEGDTVNLSWQWRNDRQRRLMNRLSKKGYFKRFSSRGTDTYLRTIKQYIPDDGPNRPIVFSFIKPVI